MSRYPLIPIGNVASFLNGLPFKPSDWSKTGHKIIRIQNLTDPQKPYNRTEKAFPEKYIVKKGDVLVSWSGTIDVFIWDREDAVLNQHIFKVKFDHTRIDKSYFIFALKRTIDELSRFAHGSTMKHIIKSDFDNHRIPLPPLPDQIRIANILSKAESLIRQRKESLRLLDEFLKSTFLEMFGDPVRNEKGWAKASLGEVVEIRGRVGWKGYKKTDLRTSGPYVLGATHLTNNGEIDLSHPVFISREKYEESPEIVIKKNDLLLVQRGNTIGKIGLVTDDLGEATINPCILILRPRKIRPRFLKQYLLNEKVITQLRGMNNASAQPMLTQSDLRDFKICLPHTDLQTQFSSIMEKTEVLSLHYDNSLQQLAQLYSSECQRAFAGKLSLKQKTTAKVKSKPQT